MSAIDCERAADTVASAAYSSGSRAATVWAAAREDAGIFERLGLPGLFSARLWPIKRPSWVDETWSEMQSALPKGEDWDVWTVWYEDRLEGINSDEAHELVFATVPLDVWEKGSKAANSWIKAELNKLDGPKPSATSPGAPAEPTTDPTTDRLASLRERPAPVELKFNAEGRIALVHRAAIVAFPSRRGGGDLHKLQEACRESATRLAGDVRAERFDNFRDAHFLLALDRYAADIPFIDRDGNILLADDSADELRELAVEFEAVLPNSFARRLRQFLAKHDELRVYYVETKALDEARQAVAPLPSPPEAFVANIANAIEGPAADAFDLESHQALTQVLRPTPKVELEPGEARRPVDPAARQKRDYRILSSLARLWELITAKPVREGLGQLAAVYNTINLVKTYVWPYLEALIAWLSSQP